MPTPVAIYLLNEGSGTTAHDTGGGGFDGTLTGGANIPTWSPYGLNFNGNAACKVSLPDSILGTSCGDFSIEAWVAIGVSPASSANGSIVTIDGEDILLDTTTGGNFDGQAYTDPTGSTLIGEVTGASQAPPQFTHVVYTRCGTTMKIYLNSVLDATQTVSNATVTLNANPGTSALGADSAFGLKAFTGILGETRFYNVCLSATDVANAFAAHGARYGYAPVNGGLRCYFADQKTQFGTSDIWSSYRTAPGIWSRKKLIYSIKNDPPAGWTSGDIITGFSAAAVSNGPAPSVLGSLEDGSSSFEAQQLYEIVDNVTPPLVIDNAGFPDIIGDATNYFTTTQGPFSYGGSRWVVGEKVNPGTGVGTLAVYKKVSGAWVEQNAAGAPTGWSSDPFFSLSLPASYRLFGTNTSLYWDGVSRFLQFVYFDGTSFQLIEFDMNNPSSGWGSPHDPVTISGAMLFMACLLPASNGQVNLFYQTQQSSTQTTVFLQTLSGPGGTWSSALQVNSLSTGASFFNQVFVDPGDPTILHAFWGNISTLYTSTQPWTTAYYQRIVAGVLGTAFSFPTVHSQDTPSNMFGHGVLSSGSLYLPFDNNSITGMGNRPSMYIGTPLSAPSWTSELIDVDVTDGATCTFLQLEIPAVVLQGFVGESLSVPGPHVTVS